MGYERKDNQPCLTYELGTVWLMSEFWIRSESNTLIEPMNVYSLDNAANSKSYMFYDLNTNVIIESNDVKFYEEKFSFKLRNSKGTELNHIPVIRSTESNNKVEIELRRSKIVRVVKYYWPNYAAYNIKEDPINLQEVLSSLDADL